MQYPNLKYPCFLKSRLHIVWATEDDNAKALTGTVIKHRKEESMHKFGHLSDKWDRDSFSPCKETPELLKLLGLLKLKGKIHV